MTSTRPSDDTHGYALRVRGRLDARWAAWFEDQTVTYAGDGITVIDAPGLDQAALHGLLRRIRDAGLALISVTQTEPDTD